VIFRALGALVLTAAAVSAQAVPAALTPGRHVVVYAPSVTVQPLDGTVMSANNDRLTVKAGDLTAGIPWQHISSVEYDGGRLYAGTVIGVAFGALLGGVGHAVGDGGSRPSSAGESVLVGAALFGAVGSLFDGRRWRSISADKFPKSGALPMEVAIRDGARAKWIKTDTVRVAVGPNKFYGALLGAGVGGVVGAVIGKKSGDQSIGGYVAGWALVGAITLARPLAPALRPRIAVKPQ
jgi:hypothetical protein